MRSYTIYELFTMKNGKPFQSESKRSYFAEDNGGIDRSFLPQGDYIVRNDQTGEVIEYSIAGSGVILPNTACTPTVLPVREIEIICPNCNLVIDVPVPTPHSG